MARGEVVSINISAGGVPKLPVDRAKVTVDGLAGDRQRNLEHHGGRQRALCVYSAELLDALRAEGHGVLPGATGENLTVRGIAWDAMTVGTRFRAGTVEAEVTAFANPCHNLRPYFVDGRFGRIAQKAHPGWSRVYARVLVEGEVVVGASFELLVP